ncbi:MAG: transcriptional repressor [Prevotella sp.]|nr:transcriptional repressor [Prevotella sp.]
MKESIREKARLKLTNYLEGSDHRKTPERFAILDAIYSLPKHFTLEELNEDLVKKHFPVSRATLYSSIRMFLELRLVVRHNFLTGTKYEACLQNEEHCHQICTVCSKVTELQLPEVVDAVNQAHYHRFKKDGFSLYIYGICSSCQAKITKRKRKEEREKNKKTKK